MVRAPDNFEFEFCFQCNVLTTIKSSLFRPIQTSRLFQLFNLNDQKRATGSVKSDSLFCLVNKPTKRKRFWTAR